MSKFIEVTKLRTGTKVFINVDNIVRIEGNPNNGDRAQITYLKTKIVGCESVEETYDEVVRKIMFVTGQQEDLTKTGPFR